MMKPIKFPPINIIDDAAMEIPNFIDENKLPFTPHGSNLAQRFTINWRVEYSLNMFDVRAGITAVMAARIAENGFMEWSK